MHSHRKRFRIETQPKRVAEVLSAEWHKISRGWLHLLASDQSLARGGGGLRREAGQSYCRWTATDVFRRSIIQSLAEEQKDLDSENRARQVPHRPQQGAGHHRHGSDQPVHFEADFHDGEIDQQPGFSELPKTSAEEIQVYVVQTLHGSRQFEGTH